MSFEITRSRKDRLDHKSLVTELTDEDLSKVTGGCGGGTVASPSRRRSLSRHPSPSRDSWGGGDGWGCGCE